MLTTMNSIPGDSENTFLLIPPDNMNYLCANHLLPTMITMTTATAAAADHTDNSISGSLNHD